MKFLLIILAFLGPRPELAPEPSRATPERCVCMRPVVDPPAPALAGGRREAGRERGPLPLRRFNGE